MAREDPMPAVQEEMEMEEQATAVQSEAVATPMSGTLTLPSNATSIRADITDNFSCANKSYGYYADVENDCQIFHVCLPVTYADGKENTFRWSFICPEETIFSQESFTCMRREDMTIECEDSQRYYELNGSFGALPEEEKQQAAMAEPPSEQSEQEKPQAAAPAEPSKEPIREEPVKPVKQQKPKRKPNRPKPAVIYNKPQRKVPLVATTAPVIEITEEVVTPDEPIKPQRFSPRPQKEKPQPVKPVVANPPVRTELFNTIRKRPAVFNKPTTTKPLEVAAEEEEDTKPAVTEAVLQLSEPQPTLKLQTMFKEPEVVEEPQAQASTTAELIVEPQTQPEEVKLESVEPLKAEEVKPLEAIEEIPAVIVESLEEVKPSIPELELQSEPEKVKLVEVPSAEPSIQEPSNSQEEALHQLEELEAAKPADAPESLPATAEMLEPNPLVEQMLDESPQTNQNQESLGGFKPVDPAMAAEAEQLITDFLNTLRKNEEKTKTETEMATAAMQMADTLEQEPSQAVSIEEAKLPEPEIVDQNASIEEQLIEETESKLKQDSPIINIMQLKHTPQDYQIPVQIISAPEEVKEVESDLKPESLPLEEDKVSDSLATAAYMPPISIDDIVELVKERLDQTPKNEQMAPMELVLTPGADAPLQLIQSQNEEAQEPQQEDIILPIYKRISLAEPGMSNLQTLPVTVSKIETDTEKDSPATQPELKMDARKRRFLFRADAS